MDSNVTLHAESLSTCYFKSSAKVPIRSLRAHFEPTQSGSGEPSGDNVREIIGYDSQPIYITSSDNLFKGATLVNGYVRDNTGQEVESSTYYYVSTIFDIDTNNANYYVLYYHNTADVKFRVYFLDADDQWINRTGTLTWRANNNYINFLGMLTKPENYKKIQFQFANTVNINDIEFMTIDKIQVNFPILGKNKLNSEWENGQIVTGTGQPQASTSSIRLTNKINVIPGKTYVLSWTSGNRNIYRFAYKKDGTFSRYLGLQSVSGSSAITFQNDEYYLWIYQWDNTTPPENMQLELGSTATEYEPYSSNNIIYGGYVDPIKGIAAEEWTGSRTLNGTTDTSSSSYTNYATYLTTEDVFGAGRKFTKQVNDALTTVYCDSLPISYDYTPTTFPYLHLSERNGIIIYTVIMGKLSEHPEITDANNAISYTCNYLQEHNVTVRWKSTPIEYPIESITRTTQMGTNFVWGTTSYKFEVDYDLHETRAIQSAKRRIAANEPHLETVNKIMASFNTDLKAPVNKCRSYFEPIQEYNGYDRPWPAGGGKNIFPNIGNTDSNNGMDCSYDSDTGVYTINGTSENSVLLKLANIPTLNWNENDYYALSVTCVGGSMTAGEGTGITWAFAIFSSDNQKYIRGSTSETTIDTTTNLYYGRALGFIHSSYICYLQIWRTGTVANNLQIKIQLEKIANSTSLPTSWEPYQNICQIGGYTKEKLYLSSELFVDTLNFTSMTDSNVTLSKVDNGVYQQTGVSSDIARFDIPIKSIQLKANTPYYWWVRFLSPETHVVLNTVGIALRNGNKSVITGRPTERIGDISAFTLQEDANLDGLRIVFINNFNAGKFTFNILGTPTITTVNFPVTKNLFPSALPSSAITASISNNVITQAAYSKLFAINCDANTDYVCSNAVRFGWSVGFSNKLPELGDTIDYKGSMTNRDSFKVNSGNNAYMIITVPQESIFETLSTYRPQIEKGSAATSYEPYKTCYGGYVDPINGKLVMEWGLYRLPLLTSINVSMDQYIKADACDGWVIPSPAVINMGSPSQLNYTPLSNKLKFDKSSIWSSGNKVNCFTINSNQLHMNIDNKLLGITDYTQETRASVATKLINYFNTEYNNGNYFEFAYKLATPVEYPLTSTQLKTLLGTNNIWSNTNGNTSVTYWTH